MHTQGRLDWDRDAQDWPGRSHSRFIETQDGLWHVQVSGGGPVMLLLHGTGASSHTWRDLAPLLARHFTVVSPDLPGHAFTRLQSPHLLSLPGMAAATARLMSALALRPSLVVGHSAGAAVAVQGCLEGGWAPALIVSLCGALLPLQGLAGWLMPPAARLLAASGLSSLLVARPAQAPGAMERMLESTGSTIDARGVELYRRLAGSPAHVEGVVEMMARWRLEPMQSRLAGLKTPMLLIVAGADRTVPASEASRVQARVPSARRVDLKGLGHLAHEEQPQTVCQILWEAARHAGVSGVPS